MFCVTIIVLNFVQHNLKVILVISVETLGITATILKELSSDDLKELKKELTFGGRIQIEKLYKEIRD